MRTVLPILILCSACGPDAKSDSAADMADPGPTSGTLRVLTYNVAGLPDGISSAEGALLDRMPAIKSKLSEYDLIGLQEDFDEAAHTALTEGSGHAEVQWFSERADDERVYGAGLSQVLPWASTAYREEHYTHCNGVLDGASDCLASKGFQTTSLRLGSEVLDVYNTHHEAGGGPEDADARLAQVDQLLAAVDTHSVHHAVLLTGDFNLHPDDLEDAEPLGRYEDANLQRACDLVGCPEANHIDQIRVRSSPTLSLEVLEWSRATEFVSDEGVDLSDHPAISAVIAWEVVGS